MYAAVLPTILTYSLIILGFLFWIDLKTRLLPNRFVFQFFICGIAVHIVTGFATTTALQMLMGMLISAGMLLAIRAVGNIIYKTDTLGMGDVKLIGAAGIWLGTSHIFIAISLGAIAGVLHGLLYAIIHRLKSGEALNFATLSLPAGPGFIIGIVTTVIIKFHKEIIALL